MMLWRKVRHDAGAELLFIVRNKQKFEPGELQWQTSSLQHSFRHVYTWSRATYSLSQAGCPNTEVTGLQGKDAGWDLAQGLWYNLAGVLGLGPVTRLSLAPNQGSGMRIGMVSELKLGTSNLPELDMGVGTQLVTWARGEHGLSTGLEVAMSSVIGM